MTGSEGVVGREIRYFTAWVQGRHTGKGMGASAVIGDPINFETRGTRDRPVRIHSPPRTERSAAPDAN